MSLYSVVTLVISKMKNLVGEFTSFLHNHPNLKQIAVQVPDYLLPDSVALFETIQTAFPQVFFFALTDTSFNDCCVDHISAQHLTADGILHFGPYCTQNYSIPVCFVSNEPENKYQDSVSSQIEAFIASSSAEKIFLLLDQVSFVPELFTNDSRVLPVQKSEEGEGFKFYEFNFPAHIEEVKSSSSAIIYVGPHSKIATDLGSLCFQQPSLLINSSTGQPFSVNLLRDLAKRSSVIDVAKECTQVGIVVENPNIDLHIKLAQVLQNLCFANDIFANILYVGRVNEAKIGNFPDLECFVHISCGGKELFTFAKPVLSPFEFICAKFSVDFWNSQELRDFDRLLSYCTERSSEWMSHRQESDSDKQVAIKDFYQLTVALESNRSRYSYYGLEIDQANRDMQLHKGATGNSVSYDHEPPAQ